MKQNQKFCHNHPERLTFRHCYTCHKPVCQECRFVKSHHIFCGRWCWIRYHSQNFIKPIKTYYHKKKALVLNAALLMVFVGIILWLAVSLQRIQSQLNQIRKNEAAPALVSESTSLKKMILRSPAQAKGMIYRNTITIEGEADANSVVMLLKGDKLIQSAQPVDGLFFFSNIHVNRGDNTFIVQMMSPDGERLALETVHFRYNSPTIRYLSHSLYRGDKRNQTVALTFDGGYLNNVSEEILDYLRNANIKATFFLTGIFIKNYPETIKRIVAEGHEVGNHTMSHPHLTTFAENGLHNTRIEITREVLQDELLQMAQLFQNVTGQKIAPLWRAPYGEQNVEICEWAAELGYRQIGWTVGTGNGENMDTMDWVANPENPGYKTAEEVRNRIFHFADSTENGANGAIILMHLGSNRTDDYPHRKLPEIIKGIQQRGYHFVTISQMIAQKEQLDF